MQVLRVHRFARLPGPAEFRDDTLVIEAGEQVLPEAPCQEHAQQLLTEIGRGDDESAYSVSIRTLERGTLDCLAEVTRIGGAQ